MATKIWVNIGSGNGLLPDGTEPLPEPSVRSSDSHLRVISQPLITRLSLKITIKYSFKSPRGQWVKALHYWFFVIRNSSVPVDFHHRGHVIWKVCHVLTSSFHMTFIWHHHYNNVTHAIHCKNHAQGSHSFHFDVVHYRTDFTRFFQGFFASD